MWATIRRVVADRDEPAPLTDARRTGSPGGSLRAVSLGPSRRPRSGCGRRRGGGWRSALNPLYRGMVEANIRRALDVAAVAGQLDHRGLLGRAREIFVAELLTPLLYPTMGACTGVIVDSEGTQSRQTDVIVFDRRIVPPLLLEASEGMIPAESALFAIEVKSSLNRREIRDAVEKGCALKDLVLDPALVAPRLTIRPAVPPSTQQVLSLEGRLSSIPTAVFAFGTDKTSDGIDGELQRMRDVMAEVNAERTAAGKKAIRVPVSALTVPLGHAECVNAQAEPAGWRTYPSPEVRTDAPLRFLSWLNREALNLTSERAAISLAKYFHDEGAIGRSAT